MLIRIGSILLDCLFVAFILQLNGWDFVIAIILFLIRDVLSFWQGITE